MADHKDLGEQPTDRRKGERRVKDESIDFDDRRAGERRSGDDRRGSPRIVAD